MFVHVACSGSSLPTTSTTKKHPHEPIAVRRNLVGEGSPVIFRRRENVGGNFPC